MAKLTKTEVDVLDAAADDLENLEQIYRRVAMEFVQDDSVPRPCGLIGGYWREREPVVLLTKVAKAIANLVSKDRLVPRMDENGQPWQDPGDQSLVWRAWFEVTDQGREVLSRYST